MPSISGWLGNNRLTPVNAGIRAVAAWKRINDKPVSIVVTRGGANQAAQTVRIEFDEIQTDVSAAGDVSRRNLVIFGVKDHPSESITDTSLLPKDLVKYGGLNYEIRDVIDLPGEIQARATRIS
jgi:hypothetical protein